MFFFFKNILCEKTFEADMQEEHQMCDIASLRSVLGPGQSPGAPMWGKATAWDSCSTADHHHDLHDLHDLHDHLP